MDFVGRRAELQLLQERVEQVRRGDGGTRGQAFSVIGRRRVGKSRLLQEFCDRSGLPYVVFQATNGRNPAAERADFAAAVAGSTLPGREAINGLQATDWNHALRLVDLAVPADMPSIVVIDEVPWLVEQDGAFEGALQTVWDRQLSAKPVLLFLVGSDLSMMEALQSYGRPFFGRALPWVVQPLNVADVATMTETDAADAIDALLVTGGFPEVVRAWEPGVDIFEFLRSQLGNPLSPLLMAGELTVLGEFPEPSATRAVVEAIGTGERTFSTIAAEAGGNRTLAAGTLSPILATLTTKGVVAVDSPLSTHSDTKNKRYRIADAYLRFWLAFLNRGLPLVERGRGDQVLMRITRSWTGWRGRAVEPFVRESLARLLPNEQWPDTDVVGGWWNRQNNPEIDIVGADRDPVAKVIHFLGSIKWLDNDRFDRHNYDELTRSVLAVPGTSPATPLVAVSRIGFAEDLPLAARWGPDDLVGAWYER